MAKQATRRATRKRSTPAVVYFGSAAVQRPNADATLPAKFARILKKLDLKHLCQGARVPIKMHLGGGLGYTTIHPVFVRALVRALQDAGGKPFVVDAHFGTIASAAERGYTAEALGCPIVAAGGPYDSHVVVRKVRHRRLREVRILGAIWDAPCLINFAHVKGHGDCGHAGACKNVAMGCVDGRTRGALHSLEGGIDWIAEKCTLCGRCVKACDTGAVRLDRKKKRISIFFHNCRYCRHCVLACPEGALVMRDPNQFKQFQEGMALATKTVLASFDPSRVLHVNLLTNITMFCDCWGMTTPNLVPDIGVMASHDLVALEAAALDAIRAEDFIPGSTIGGRRLGAGEHLWEKIHGKDPYVQVRALARRGVGTARYRLVEVE